MGRLTRENLPRSYAHPLDPVLCSGLPRPAALPPGWFKEAEHRSLRVAAEPSLPVLKLRQTGGDTRKKVVGETKIRNVFSRHCGSGHSTVQPFQ